MAQVCGYRRVRGHFYAIFDARGVNLDTAFSNSGPSKRVVGLRFQGGRAASGLAATGKGGQ